MDSKKLPPKIFWGMFGVQKCSLFLSCFGSPPRRPQEGPRGAQEAPGSLQECPKRPQEAPKTAPGGSKRGLKRPRESVQRAQNPPKRCQEPLKTRSRLFRSTWSGSRFRKNEKFKAWLQKASKTLKVAEIYESQRPCPNSQNEKRRAGGGDPPWGSQSAARSGAEEQGVSDK